MTTTRALADFVAGLDYADLSAEVLDAARRVFVDAVGCALGAATEEARKAKIAVDLADAFAARPEASVIGGGRTHAALAALANGFLVNATDNDDTHKRALIHTGSVVVPPALAVTEAMDGGGRDLVTALVAGYEVAVRVGMAVMPTHYKYWHSTATNGTFGAAAAAARAYGLDAAETLGALGFAGTQAAGLNTFFESGDDSKSVHPGKAGFNGVLAAMLARAGATSPPDVLGHPKGYLAAYSDAPKPEALTAGLGSDWEIVRNGFKPYPSILASHSPIGAALDLVAGHAIDPGAIRSVAINTYATVKSHFSNKDIASEMAARLSVPYCVAVALVDGRITQAQFGADRYRDPVVQGVLAKTEVVADPELTPLYPEKFPARVTVTLENGDTLEETYFYPKGDPDNPLSDADLEDKFRANAGPVLGDAGTEAFLAMTRDLAGVTVADLVGPLRRGD